MAYAELDEVRDWLGIKTTTHDHLLTSLRVTAQEMIDTYCRRTFEALESTTRYYRPDAIGTRDAQRRQNDIYNQWLNYQPHARTLHLDTDLLSIDAGGLVNGNGVVLPDNSYDLEPLNTTPKHWIVLKSQHVWTFDIDGTIRVTGKWAYSTTAPANIAQACKELVAYLYRTKDVNTFEMGGNAEIGQIGVPVKIYAIPANIQYKLKPYQRRRIG